MTKGLKLSAALLATTLFASAFIGGGASSARVQGEKQTTAPAAQTRGLTPQERRGKAVYQRGESPSGGEIVAVIGEIDVPGSTVSCAVCHGLKGEGKTEGGVTAGALTWAHLFKPGGHTHPSGRRHDAFTEETFTRAVTGGVDPSGNELAAAMPRYKIPAADLADLVAYLKRIESDADPGVTEDSIKVGTVVPSAGPLAEMGAAMRDVLTAYFEGVNAGGGIYNRRVELRVADGGADSAATANAVRGFYEREQPFALVGGISAGADKDLAALLALAGERGLPFVGLLTLSTHTHAAPNRHVFYLMPGVTEQSRALVNFAAARRGPKKPKLYVAYAENELARAAANAVEDQAKKSGWDAPSIVRVGYAQGTFDAARLVRRLKAEGAEVLFLLCSGGEDSALIKEAAAAGWTPEVFLLAASSARDLSGAVTPGFKDKIFLAFPTVPSDISPEGIAEFRALQAKYKFAPRHTASQLAAFGAAKVFVEALKRAGRDLSREKLIAALEGLYDFETGVTPRLTFGPNRRVGAAGASIVIIDPDEKEFARVVGWVKAY